MTTPTRMVALLAALPLVAGDWVLAASLGGVALLMGAIDCLTGDGGLT